MLDSSECDLGEEPCEIIALELHFCKVTFATTSQVFQGKDPRQPVVMHIKYRQV